MARFPFFALGAVLFLAVAAFLFNLQRPAMVLARGRKNYQTNCLTCHGETGQGDGLAARLGVQGVANLRSAEARALSDQALFEIITHGKGKMEGYGETLSTAQRRAIVVYVRSLQTP